MNGKKQEAAANKADGICPSPAVKPKLAGYAALAPRSFWASTRQPLDGLAIVQLINVAQVGDVS
jgi:hypothetical protein